MAGKEASSIGSLRPGYRLHGESKDLKMNPAYSLNLDTNKFHKITLISWDHVEFDPHPLDEMPEGEYQQVDHKMTDIGIVFQSTVNGKPMKSKTEEV